ncbi:MAG: hypothetical protein LBL82_02780 [Oscillospiraceae bacterium]|nr:hypothetical protein [Oscillospiraceae bacterium]
MGQAFVKACRFLGQRPKSPSAEGETLLASEKRRKVGENVPKDIFP